MENEIVYVSKKELFVSSLTVAEMLDVPHKVLFATIQNIVKRIEQNKGMATPLLFPQVFKESTFKNKMNREYSCYELNEQAFLKLAMKMSGYEKAEVVQDAIIEAFSKMKRALLNKDNATWLNARNAGKEIRLQETDVIKEFVEYATKQGSKSANMYYMNITKMTNKALELLVQVQHGEPLRDLLTIQELGFIQVLENRATQAIEYGMKENLPYKFIYQYAKDEVNKLADSLNFRKSIEKL